MSASNRKGSKDLGGPPKVHRICLTGGPCAGKTTASSVLKERLGDKYILYFLPEVAATTVLSGVVIVPSEFTPDTHKVFTEGIVKVQMELEDYFNKIASIQKKDVIIISDRGCMDNFAYCTSEVRDRVMKDNNWSVEKIRDERYDAVVHLVTAADGAEKFYSLENNQARTETPDVARWLDKKCQSVWNGHPNFTVISNTSVGSFKQKMDEVFKCICKVIDIPEMPSFQGKYLIKGDFDISKLPQDLEYEVYIEEIHYLNSESKNEEVWVKKRISKESKGETFSFTRRRLAKVAAEKLELMRNITRRQYEDYLKLSDKSKKMVSKEIIVFVYDNQNCVVEDFQIADKRVSVLRAYVVDPQNVKIPSFIEVKEEITENPEYFTWNLAQSAVQKP